MLVAEAKQHVGQVVRLSYQDRTGAEIVEDHEIIDVAFVPLYGPCFVTASTEIRLDRITSVEVLEQRKSA